ncbi:SDR family oxidoreductase [Thalassovita sp.]|jgi:NAD(P)-dependent dehydrogenase (short-subunit alcohol dehydrogenase family)|uniref:SDR family oxidoreductase n=1 Tax=Thalassovita sp. TaxID=1979401 RepID=UPI002AB2C1EF|nr:SDR family oxidoreductase [Thalassovita sp.]MEC7965921.1 SDR family oxidoreductase [Pseudomonadota bacterium]
MNKVAPITKPALNVDDIFFTDAYEQPAPQNSAVLVTGAAKRLGRAIAADLAGAGWRVVIHYNGSKVAAGRLKNDIEAAGGRAEIVQADLSIPDEASKLIERAENLCGPIGVLVNNASVFEWDDLPSATSETFEQHMGVHVKSPLLLCQHFADRLPEQAGGTIVNVIDSRVLSPSPRHLTYTLSKSGLWNLTQILAEEFAPRIRVNAIGPGPILPEAGRTEEHFRDRCSQLPLQRPASLSEVCETIRFLLSQKAITGQMIALDGGEHLTGYRPRPSS